MEMFCSAFGSEAGDMALKFLPFGGIFITGGIAHKNLDLLAARRTVTTPGGVSEPIGFMSNFLDKGRMGQLLSGMPVKVVLAPDCGQRGAHLVAYQTCHGGGTTAADTTAVATSAAANGRS